MCEVFMRLNRYIAACGVCSRREADKLIASGQILINGKTAELGAVVEDGDTVTYNGKTITRVEETVVLAYYKPVGVVCTERDPHAERTVLDDIDTDIRVTYAGRLDMDSEGLLILTNNGSLIDAMMKGSHHHEKEYIVDVDRDIDKEFIRSMEEGIYLKDLGVKTRPCKAKKIGPSSFDIILTQGLNRQIRRMCAALGAEVVRLKRIRVMTVHLEDYELNPGEYVRLNDDEIKKLMDACK
jgi:23S rRNA pseudouridine2604 synthase